MKLLVILLCLLSERCLVHAVSPLRFNWFFSYCKRINQLLPKTKLFSNPITSLVMIVLPLLVLWALILSVADSLLFGFITLLLNLALFYYCLGPHNPFYPVRTETETEVESSELVAGRYFAQVNGQLFSVVFWYLLGGTLAVLSYRLIALCREQELTAQLARRLTDLLDWIPARITLLFYLLVGNFQQGFRFYRQKFLSTPKNNDFLLSEGGLLAARTNESELVQLPYAESLVGHAMIAYLVFFTLVALI